MVKGCYTNDAFLGEEEENAAITQENTTKKAPAVLDIGQNEKVVK